jgi:hypothetical protein
MLVCPASAAARSSRILIVVDFPDPLGPRKPVTRPGSMVNVESSTTVLATVPLRHVGDLEWEAWAHGRR